MTRTKEAPKLYLEGNRYRISLTYFGTRYRFALGLTNNKVDTAKAEKVLQLVLDDVENNTFDTTYAKYKQFAKLGKQVSEMSLSEAYQLWINYKAPEWQHKTAKWYRGHIYTIEQALGNKPVSQLTRRDSQVFTKYCSSLNISPYTIRRKLEAIKQCFTWLIMEGHISSNPFEYATKAIGKIRKWKRKPFTEDEVKRILSAFEQSVFDKAYYMLVKFLFETGCRTGEALGLRWEDLHSQCRTVAITRQYTDKVFKPCKAGSEREFTLTIDLAEALRVYKETIKPKQSDLVFSVKGKPINLTNFRRRAWIPIQVGLDIVPRPFYSTRHTFVSHMLDKGVDPMQVVKITGHLPQTMFQHYASSINKQVEIPAGIYGDALGIDLMRLEVGEEE